MGRRLSEKAGRLRQVENEVEVLHGLARGSLQQIVEGEADGAVAVVRVLFDGEGGTPDEPGAEARRIEIERLERLARTMDSAFGIPGTRLRIGLDGIIGLIPGIGDTLALAPALYIVAKGAQLGVPGPTLGRMGVEEVAEIEGGFAAWSAAGLPVLPPEPAS